MNRCVNVVVGLLMVMLVVGCAGDRTSLSGSRPNIILIMADDLGYSDLGIHGNDLMETPNLDQLALESVQFNNFYVTPVCATTRAALLTGRHFLRTGVSHVHGGKDFMHLDEITLADALKCEGYATGMWGKWHSGKTPGYFPWERGFDEAFMASLYKYQDNAGLLNGMKMETEGWITEVLTDYAIDFIKRNSGQPFFAYLPYLTCHAPLKAPEQYREKYLEKGLSENLATLYGMVEHMDFHLGRLFDALDELKLSENTIVIFLSDNGPAIINGVLSDEDRRIRYVNGMRGHKGNIWENGIRSPLFVRFEGHHSPAIVDRLVDVTDLFPTLVELAGAEENADQHNMDGRSIVSYLMADIEALPDKEIFLYANPGWPPTDKPWTPEGVMDEYRPWKFAGGDNLSYEKQIMGVRREQYKLLLNPGPTDGAIVPDGSGYVLVDLKSDQQELNNVVNEYPEIFDKMKTSLMRWHQEVFSCEHAFEMPVFQVGKDTSVSYSVLAYGPQSTSRGVKSASSYITNFRHPGDSAAYMINVEETGTYRMEIAYWMESGDPVQFDLVLPGGKFPFEFSAGSRPVNMKGLLLSAGITNFTITNKTINTDADPRIYKMLITHQEGNPRKL